MAKKPKKYWAGFCDSKINTTIDGHSNESDLVLAIYLTRKIARKYYEDVRPVEIREIK